MTSKLYTFSLALLGLMPKVLKLKGTQFVAAKFRLVQDETLGTIHVFTAKDKTPVFT